MVVMNHDGDLFDERRTKKERRKSNQKIANDRRKESRRKININDTKKEQQ